VKELIKMKAKKDDENIDPRKAKLGDVLAIRWYDTISMERVEWEEFDDIQDPEMTRCWGAVVHKSDRYLYIASEMGDRMADSMWVEALPYRLIEECKLLERIKI